MSTATEALPVTPAASGAFPAFEPHPWIPGGHAQTIVGRYLFRTRLHLPSTPHEIDVGGGDRLLVLDAIPERWAPGGPAAVLVHGLSGCARSPYVVRLAIRLAEQGIRTVQVNLRNAGEGFGIARGIYHSGRTEDLRPIGRWLAARAEGSPVAWIGFSLGANLVLKLAAEAPDHPPDGLDCVLAANPPLDLHASCRQIQLPANRLYDQNFIRLLRADVAKLHARFPELGPVDLSGVASLYDFDEAYTAPRNGFQNADHYYRECSAGPLLERIAVPGLVIHAEDDPFIPAEAFRNASFPPRLALELIPSGGHLGYVSRSKLGRDRRWLEARLAAWLAQHWGLPQGDAPARPRDGGPKSHA